MAVGQPVGAVGLREGGGLIAAREHDVTMLDEARSVEGPTIPVIEPDGGLRFNDGACDPAGRFWVGTMAYDLTPRAGCLYRVEPDLSVHTVVRDVTISNGLGWSPDGDRLYYVDSPTGRVDAFDYDLASGSIATRRTVAVVDETDGVPDGLTVDAEGGIWVALWGGGAVRRYTTDGTYDAEVSLPVTNVTSCVFGAPDLSTLYITTARDGLDEEELAAQPLAGSVFRCTPGVRGLLAHRFAG